MTDWLYDLPVAWMTLVILVVTYLVTGAIYAVVMVLAVGERARAFKAVSPGMLPPLGVMFALLVGFLAAQVWSEWERANTAVSREASALRAVALLAVSFPGGPDARIHTLLRRQVQDAATQEWPAMARHGATLEVSPAPLVEALQLTLALTPRGEGQLLAQREMVIALEQVFDARRQRIIISRSTINWVKWSGLALEAILTLLAIAIVHSDNRATAAVALAIFATAVAASAVLIASHARPFTGEISVGPELLLQAMPEGRPPAPGS